MATRAELVAAISCRYVLGGRAEKARMLDEFVALTGFHRKHAMRLLRGECEPAKGGPRPGRRVYGDDVRAALVVVWEASDLRQATTPPVANTDRSDGTSWTWRYE